MYQITTDYVVLKKLKFLRKQVDLELVLGIHLKEMMKALYEKTKRLIHIRSHFLHNFRAPLIESCAETCAKDIYDHETPQDNCAGSIKCIRIETWRSAARKNAEVEVLGV